MPHWHFVTYGFCDLYEEESLTEESGYGFKLTLRLAGDVRKEPPVWPIGLLQNLARYVSRSGNVFRAGEYLPLNGPMAVDQQTLITDVIFAVDPELPRLETPGGTLDFVQIAGVTTDEASAGRRWNSVGLLETISTRLPLWVTDLARGSLLGDPEISRAISGGVAREGSSSSRRRSRIRTGRSSRSSADRRPLPAGAGQGRATTHQKSPKPPGARSTAAWLASARAAR